MSTENQTPTRCTQCNASLSSGYCLKYSGSKLIGAYCSDCDRNYSIEEYRKTKILKTNLLTTGVLDLYDLSRPWSATQYNPYTKLKTFREIIDNGSIEDIEDVKTLLDIRISYKKIYEKIKEFEQKVWFKGLQDIISKSTFKGVSAKDTAVDGFYILTLTMCGRTIITIEDKDASISMVGIEDSDKSSFGDKGISATESQAIRLIDLAIELFESGKLIFKEDKEVFYL